MGLSAALVEHLPELLRCSPWCKWGVAKRVSIGPVAHVCSSEWIRGLNDILEQGVGGAMRGWALASGSALESVRSVDPSDGLQDARMDGQGS